MRRSSLIGPLLLMAIGALFLARNLYPQLPILDYLARYWPFALIAWGFLRLAEILFWAATEKPLPRHGISGGEWALVIFLVIFGSSLYAFRSSDSWWRHGPISVGGIDMFGESFEYPLSADKQAGKTPKLVIESFRGNARITGTDGEAVKITGRKTIRSLQQRDADKANQDTPLELVEQGGQLIVRTNQDKVVGSQRISEDLEITVPKGASIEAHGRYGDFDITDVDGPAEVVSDNAGVRMQNMGGDVRVDLRRSDLIRAINVKGSVDLKGRGNDIELQNIDGQVTVTGSYSGVLQLRNLSKPLRFEGVQTKFNVEKIPGQVRLALGDFTASNLVGPILLTGRSKDVQISDFTQALEISVDRGDIEIRPGKTPLSKMEVRTGSGDVELALPPKAQFDLKAASNRGDVTNDYGAPLKGEPDGHGATLQGSVGAGPMLSITTDRGTVTVRKAAADEQAVTFPDVPSAGENPPAPPKPPKPPKAPKPAKPVEQF